MTFLVESRKELLHPLDCISALPTGRILLELVVFEVDESLDHETRS